MNLVRWWALLVLLGWAAAPVAARLFPRFPDRGLAFAKPLAMVAVVYASWLGSSFGVRHGAALIAAIAVLLATGIVLQARSGLRLPKLGDESFRSEALFAGSLLFFAGIRALEPDIFGAEKYMDFAFLNALLRAETFPPEDPWLAGTPINYYYFGYLVFADLTRLTGVPPEIGYNLAVATIGAFLFTGVTSLARLATGSLAAGLLGGAAASLLGNLDGALQILIERKGLAGFDWWRSSRVVEDTINEFPFFTLLHGDLHPHLTALAIDLPLAAIGAAGIREGRLRPEHFGALVLLFAALLLANPWDLPVYLAFVGLAVVRALALARFAPGVAVRLALALGGTLVAAVVLALPFTLRFHAPFQGIGRVHAQTALGPFVTVFGLLLLPPAASGIRGALASLELRDELRDLSIAAGVFALLAAYVTGTYLVLALAASLLAAAMARLLDPAADDRAALASAWLATGAVAIAACEVVFLRDSYGTALHRMNTVFKFYFQAWILLAAAFPYFATRLMRSFDRPSLARNAAALVLAVGVAASLCYPAAVVTLRARDGEPLSLDGMRYLEGQHADDAAAIAWLRENVRGTPVVAEATGDPYSYFARVSSNTGLPTVLGWANHEGVWRGHQPDFDRRKRDLETLYESVDLDEVRRVLRSYAIRYVFVGELERREHAGPGLDKFDGRPQLFERAFQSRTTTVFAVADGAPRKEPRQ